MLIDLEQIIEVEVANLLHLKVTAFVGVEHYSIGHVQQDSLHDFSLSQSSTT